MTTAHIDYLNQNIEKKLDHRKFLPDSTTPEQYKGLNGVVVVVVDNTCESSSSFSFSNSVLGVNSIIPTAPMLSGEGSQNRLPGNNSSSLLSNGTLYATVGSAINMGGNDGQQRVEPLPVATAVYANVPPGTIVFSTTVVPESVSNHNGASHIIPNNGKI